MSDVQARVADLLAEHACFAGINSVVCDCGWQTGLQPQGADVWTPYRAHVAAVLAEAGLLTDPSVDQVTGSVSRIEALIEASSLGTAEAKEARARVSNDAGRALVLAARYLGERDAARAKLAEWRKVAGVATPDEMRQDNADIEEALTEFARVKAELAEIKAELGQWKDRMWATVHERAVWQHDLGEHTGDLPFMHCPECGRIEAVRRSEDAERRGAVAALRDLAAELDWLRPGVAGRPKHPTTRLIGATALRKRADRIEKGGE